MDQSRTAKMHRKHRMPGAGMAHPDPLGQGADEGDRKISKFQINKLRNLTDDVLDRFASIRIPGSKKERPNLHYTKSSNNSSEWSTTSETEDFPSKPLSEKEVLSLFEKMMEDMNLNEDRKAPLREKDFATKKEMVMQYISTASKAGSLKSSRQISPQEFIHELKSGATDERLVSYLDSLRVSLTSNPVSWVESFGHEGLGLLLDILERMVDGKRHEKIEKRIQHKVIQCLKAFMNNKHGLERIMGEERSLSLLAKAMDPDQANMMTDVVKLLSAICIVGEENILEKVLEAITTAAEERGIDRFSPIVGGLHHNLVQLQIKCRLNHMMVKECFDSTTKTRMHCFIGTLWNDLQEEKRLLEREYKRIPKAGEIKKRITILKENIEELQKENTQRRLEIKALKEDVEAKQKETQKQQKELEKKLEAQEVIKDELVQLHNIPLQIGKDTEKINRKIMEAEKKKTKLEEECQELNHSLKQMETRSIRLLEEKDEVKKELERNRTLLENREQEFNHLTTLLEMAKENEAVALGERAAVDLNLQHVMIDKQTQHDTLTRKQREKDRELRNIKKMELQLKSASDALAHTQSLFDKVKAEVDSYPKDGSTHLEKRRELQKEVEVIRRHLAQQQTLTEVEVHLLDKCIAEEEQRVKEQGECREELVNLTRLVQIKSDEREQKSRDLIKAQQRYKHVLQEIKGRDLLIGEHKKKKQEVQKRLKEFAKMYDIIRNERNKCVGLIQTATQRSAELREKIKIFGNEMEILRTSVINKDRQLQKAKLKESNNHMIRDSLRKDVSTVSIYLQEMKEKREQQKMELGRLTNMINQVEENMIQLRMKYETAVQDRNERGVQLIEREEEVCIFFEKINIQEMLLQNGDVEIMAMEEKIRFLKMQITEQKRQVEQIQKNLPNKRALESDLVNLQIQLSQCNDKIIELEKQTEDPEKENRSHLLDGKDPSLQELLEKIEKLELHLAEKEERLLEKEFLYEQVSRLSERLRSKVENGKQDKLMLAKKLNEVQKKIKDTTRKMMSLIAELSMQQANSIKLQQELRDKEKFVETCYTRMEQGLPPSEEMENEWKRLVREKHRYLMDKEEKARIAEEEEQRLMPNGVYTTAEQRPNAYIPENEDALPLPRPYGALAPFKPSELGSNMRHIRKPTLKPIEI